MFYLSEKFKYENVKTFIESDNEYQLLTDEKDYQNSKTILSVKHLTCGNIFNVRGHHFVNDNNRCPKCNKNKYFCKRVSQEEFTDKVQEIVGDEYIVVGTYINNSTKIDLLHTECGEIYSVTPKHFLHTGCRCTNCKQTSRGETNIKYFLDTNFLNYQREYKFKDLWNKKHTTILEFDFAIFENEKLKCLIEFDGIGHFQPIFPVGGTDEERTEQLRRTQENDTLKNEFCQINNIPLIRIDYTKRDKKVMEPILKEMLDKLNDYPELEYTKNGGNTSADI